MKKPCVGGMGEDCVVVGTCVDEPLEKSIGQHHPEIRFLEIGGQIR
jgi:hypothetical protein